MLLPETSPQGAEALAEKLRASIETGRFEHENFFFSVTMTLGIATFGEGDTLDSCIVRADAALYEGKEQGRYRVMVAS